MASVVAGRELLRVAAPVVLATAKDHTVKGFASVETLDRSQDIVHPEEFRIKQFLAAPTMMVNHRYWVDEHGNEVGAGVPKELFVAELKDVGKSDVWGIVDVDKGAVVNEFPKNKIPDLVPGNRGLFIVANVTQPGVWREVEKGTLQAFSWRGLVKVEYKAIETGVQRNLKDVDLYEISLVNVPDQPSSTFVIGKSALGEPLTVSHVELAKSHFGSEGQAVEYLKSHGLQFQSVVAQNDTWVAAQNVQNETFDSTSFVRTKMQPGVCFIAGKMQMPQATWLETLMTEDALKLAAILAPSESREKTMADKVEDTKKPDEKVDAAKTADQKTDTSKSTDTKVDEKTGEKKVEAKVDDAAKKSETEKGVELLATKTAEAVASALKPTFDVLTNTLSGLTQVTQKSVDVLSKLSLPETQKTDTEKKPETDAEKKADVAKTVDLKEVSETLATFAKGILAMNQKIEEVSKTAKGIAKATPTQEHREEATKVDASKGAKVDPLDVFNGSGMWPFK